MTRAMVTLFTAKPQHQVRHASRSASAPSRGPVRAALLAVISKLS